jgi:1-deoxy-D-xylulose-5-phosphate reductoisomerase
LIILGSTGSIGVNSLVIAKRYDLDIEILVAGHNIGLLNTQLKEFSPKLVIIASKDDIHKVNHPNVRAGQNAILKAIENSTSKLVVNALVGFFGLQPTLKAIACKKRVALANKESLVAAGKFIDTSYITPIDSEHFGLWYLLDNEKTVHSLTITASGGSFRDYPLEQLASVTVKEALKHPNWSMGNKITIDSATMTNKLFELIEARWLFDTIACDAIIETKSIIHAMVNYMDGSTTAHLAHANMQLPIAYALMGEVDTPILNPINLLELQNLEFKKIETSRYKIWEIKDEILQNENLGVVLNAANEVAVARFLNDEITFLEIADSSLKAINHFHNIKINSIEDILQVDKRVRIFANG